MLFVEAAMYRVEAKLAKWKQIYEQLSEAQAKLKPAATDGEKPPANDPLLLEVRRLQRQSNEALDELHAAVAVSRQQRAGPSAPATTREG